MTLHVVDIFRGIGLLSGAVVVGGFVLLQFAISPTFWNLGDRDSLNVRQHIHELVHPYLPISVGITALSSVVVLILQHHFGQLRTILTAVALVCLIGVILISQLGNTPINNAFAAMSLDQIPANFRAMNTRWIKLHASRSGLMYIAFVCLVVAALIR